MPKGPSKINIPFHQWRGSLIEIKKARNTMYEDMAVEGVRKQATNGGGEGLKIEDYDLT